MAPQFTQKHYNAVARILQDSLADVSDAPGEYNGGQWDKANQIAIRFAHLFEDDSPKFNRQHFIAVVEGRKALNSRL